MNAKILCEVVCNDCGGMIGYEYKNAGTIRYIKHLIKDWKHIDGVNVCDKCIAKRKRG